MSNIGGECQASRDLEDAIYKLPAVAEEAVIDPPLARRLEAMAATVVLETGAMLGEADAEAHGTLQLGAFKFPSRNCGERTRSCS